MPKPDCPSPRRIQPRRTSPSGKPVRTTATALLGLLALALIGGPAGAAPSLDKEVADLVDRATYEVVVKKPDDKASGITYAKPLPWDLVPYARRTDDYLPLGTAFAIGPNTFVSAAHVMQIPGPTQWGEMYLRDRDDNIHAIDAVSKCAIRPDFVVFSLKEAPGGAHFEVNREPAKNERVFAVGNALGQGIVIREGRYTSRTPEDYQGAWEWLRFSAAASPGNSGGPLLDKHGRVLGVVERKSENENLNYALPISAVLDAEPGLARMEARMLYRIENMDRTLRNDLDLQLGLPLPLDRLREEMAAKVNTHGREAGERFFEKYREEIFPSGEGSTRILHNNYEATFPNLIGEGDDGNWSLFYPEKRKTAELGNNGYIRFGTMDKSMVLLVKKPDDLAMERFTHDSQKFMDLILQALPYKRTVGPEEVRITSLGEAERDFVHTDSFGRKWQARVWSVPHEDARLVAVSLPLPGGNATILKKARTRHTDGYIYDLKKLTDFLYISYYGTLEQWRGYLALDALLPEAFADIDIDIAYGERFRYASERLSVEYGPELMDLNEDSDLKVYFSYFREDGEVVWDVSEVLVGENKNTGVFFTAERRVRPAASMDDEAQESWAKVAEGRFPFNGDPFFNEDQTYIASVLDRGREPEELGRSEHLYTVLHAANGEKKDAVMEQRLQDFLKGLEVKEDPM